MLVSQQTSINIHLSIQITDYIYLLVPDLVKWLIKHVQINVCFGGQSRKICKKKSLASLIFLFFVYECAL